MERQKSNLERIDIISSAPPPSAILLGSAASPRAISDGEERCPRPNLAVTAKAHCRTFIAPVPRVIGGGGAPLLGQNPSPSDVLPLQHREVLAPCGMVSHKLVLRLNALVFLTHYVRNSNRIQRSETCAKAIVFDLEK
jgi:hypothetical protein